MIDKYYLEIIKITYNACFCLIFDSIYIFKYLLIICFFCTGRATESEE